MAPNPSAVAILAAVDGNLRLLKRLNKIDLREAKHDTCDGWNLLHFVAGKGGLEVCRFLVEESGFDVNSASADGGTPVAHAAEAGNVSVLRYLLDHGGSPAMPDTMGTTPLHQAADGGHFEAMTLLLSKGADVDPLNSHLATPLHLAAGKGHDQAVKVLLEHGADYNRVAHKTFSPLMMACYQGSLECMKLLVEAGADVNFKNPYGPSPLLNSVMNGSTNIVNFLLEAGADPNISDEIEKQILADAKSQGNEAFAKGDYLAATHLYEVAMHKDPLDATLYANRSLCWLRLGDGEQALSDARQCKMMRPRWSKAWYREGAALRLLKNYNGAASVFMEALKLDPANDDIKTALREVIEALRCAACSEEQNP